MNHKKRYRLNREAGLAETGSDASLDVGCASSPAVQTAPDGVTELLHGSAVQGGYQYPGRTYAGRFAHVPSASTYTACHDPHSTQVAPEGCLTCHRGVDDLRAIRMRHANFDGDGLIDEDEAVMANRYASWTPRLLRAAYNYQVVAQGPGAYTHNPTYAMQLLYDSLESLSARVHVDLVSTPARITARSRHVRPYSSSFRHEEPCFYPPSALSHKLALFSVCSSMDRVANFLGVRPPRRACRRGTGRSVVALAQTTKPPPGGRLLPICSGVH